MDQQNVSLAALAMRLRRVTERSPAMCKQLLTPLSQEARIAYVEHFESTRTTLFIDPIELNPAVRPLLLQIRDEAAHLHSEGKFGSGMGCGGRINGWIKSELLQRHGIAWNTPWEMNPDCAFD